jgi:type I restriction enzyme S subunit
MTEGGGLDLSSVRHIAEEEFAAWTKRVTPREGDVVFTYEATLNRYAIIPRGFRGCLGRRLALIRTDPRTGMNRYLYLYFFTDAWRATIARNKLSGATVDRVPLSKFPDFPVTVPTRDLLETFDRLVRPIFEQLETLTTAKARLPPPATSPPRLISGQLSVAAAARELSEVA